MKNNCLAVELGTVINLRRKTPMLASGMKAAFFILEKK